MAVTTPLTMDGARTVDLDAKRIQRVFDGCQPEKCGEQSRFDGVSMRCHFDDAKISEHLAEIRGWLMQLQAFHPNGGAISFCTLWRWLNEVWPVEDTTLAQILELGAAIGEVEISHTQIGVIIELKL